MLATVDSQVKAIQHILMDFINARFDHAIRVNPSLACVRNDLEWHIRVKVELVLRSTRSMGIEKFVVASILVGDNERLKKRVMSPTDQLSIYHQLLDIEEEGGGHEAVAVNSLKAFYKFINPVLENFTVLAESWLVWDLMDAADFARMFEDIKDITFMLKNNSATPEIEKAYRKVKNIENPTIEVSLDDILVYRWHFLKLLYERKKFELSEEPPYKMILKRDPIKGMTFDNLVIKYYQSLAKVHSMKKTGTISPQDRENYAKLLGVKPEEVTLELALQYENMNLESAKESLGNLVKGNIPLGAPYNLKQAYFKKIENSIKQISSLPQMASIIQRERMQEEEEKKEK